MNPDKLFDYLEGKLSPSERTELEERLMSDPQLRRELAVARQIHTNMGNSREIIGVAEPTLEERGAVLGRRIAIAFSVLVFANVVFGIYAIAFMKKKERTQLNTEQNRTELAESLARTAAVALPPPNLDVEEIKFTAPVPDAPSNKTLDFSVYEPFNFFPGYDTTNRLPYAEHFNLSIQRELSKSTVLTLAYVGTEGHRLITQKDANPGSAALCQQLTAQGAIDVTAGFTLGCGPGNENDVFQLPTATVPCDTLSPTPLPGCVYSTRQKILTPNFCPGGAQVCYGSNNTNTLTSANSIYNSAQITVERKATDFTFLAAYTFAKGLDDSSAFNDLVNFEIPS